MFTPNSVRLTIPIFYSYKYLKNVNRHTLRTTEESKAGKETIPKRFAQNKTTTVVVI